ncbi:MAG: hypothetical protein AAF658_20900, partial [Myxococcota bacterium]
GYGDQVERSSGTDPFNRFSFPGQGRLAFVRVNGQGERAVYFAGLSELVAAEGIPETFRVTLPDSIMAPHNPRISPGAQAVGVLDGAPGDASTVAWSILSNEVAFNQPLPLGTKVRGWVPTGVVVTTDPVPNARLSQYLAVVQRMGEERWDLLRVDIVEVDGRLEGQPTTLVSDFPLMFGPYASAGSAYFIGSPGMCVACQTIYRIPISGGTLSAPRPDVLDVRSVTYNGNRYGYLAPGLEDATKIVSFSDATELVPPGSVDIDSVVAMGSDQHLVVSADTGQGTYDLWFFNGQTRVWYMLKSSVDDLIEVDWK